MRRRPTRPAFFNRIQRAIAPAALVALLMLAVASPSSAAWTWDGSLVQRILSSSVDLTIVRPLAAARAGVGAVLLVPASILASPACAVNLITGADCRPVFEAPYEVLLAEPADYAFKREIGEL
jgi:hypothetical protein